MQTNCLKQTNGEALTKDYESCHFTDQFSISSRNSFDPEQIGCSSSVVNLTCEGSCCQITNYKKLQKLCQTKSLHSETSTSSSSSNDCTNFSEDKKLSFSSLQSKNFHSISLPSCKLRENDGRASEFVVDSCLASSLELDSILDTN